MQMNHSAMIQPTTMTVISGLTVMVAATWALGSMEPDPTGQSAAMISSSFRYETGISGNGFEPIAICQSPMSNPPLARSRLPQPLTETVADAKADIDPAKVFASLLSELERIAGNSLSEAPVYEVEFNITDRDPEYAVSIIRQIHGSLNDAGFLSSREKLPLEIQTWATSPTLAAWIEAVQDASRLQDEIDRGLSEARLLHFRTQSSAAIWPHTTRLRPALTIVVRIPVH